VVDHEPLPGPVRGNAVECDLVALDRRRTDELRGTDLDRGLHAIVQPPRTRRAEDGAEDREPAALGKVADQWRAPVAADE